MAKLVLGVVDVQGAQKLLCGLPAIHKGVIWNGTGVQDAVPMGAGKMLSGISGSRNQLTKLARETVYTSKF